MGWDFRIWCDKWAVIICVLLEEMLKEMNIYNLMIQGGEFLLYMASQPTEGIC